MNMDPWHIFTANFGHVGMPYTAFITLLDIGLYFVLTYNVGRARGYYRKAKSRMKGFVIGIFINIILFMGALAGTVASF